MSKLGPGFCPQSPGSAPHLWFLVFLFSFTSTFRGQGLGRPACDHMQLPGGVLCSKRPAVQGGGALPLGDLGSADRSEGSPAPWDSLH